MIAATERDAAGSTPPRPTREWCGLIAIDKPSGPTSHDVVDRVRRRLGLATAGHLGTLDPMATGLLMIAAGAATRCVSIWQKGAKTYEGAARFGIVTTTQDVTGEVLERRDVDLDPDAIRAASLGLVGRIDQIPPMVSAVKVGGERLYRIARRGRSVERAPRSIEIQSWDWLSFDPPDARFRVRCSSGTYVRTLVHDLGSRLGTGAALAELRRLRSEPFGLERAVTLDELDERPALVVLERAGTPLERALGSVPRVDLDRAEAEAIGHGRAVPIARGSLTADRLSARGAISGGLRSIVFFGPDADPLALGEVTPDPADEQRLIARPQVVFPWAVAAGKRTDVSASTTEVETRESEGR